jgi:predicted metalloprotease
VVRISKRELIGLAVAGILGAIYLADPNVLARGRMDRFDQTVRVSAQKPVNVYVGRPDLRVLQLIDSMNAMWAQAFHASGDTYRLPFIDAVRTRPSEGCGSGGGGWVGLYCSREKKIVIDLTAPITVRERFGDQYADDVLAYILAHEVGHHVQALRGQLGVGRENGVLKAELQAQCMAGLYGHATGRPLPPVWSYAPDEDHGTVAQQQRWLELGHRSGRPADCEQVWDQDV